MSYRERYGEYAVLPPLDRARAPGSAMWAVHWVPVGSFAPDGGTLLTREAIARSIVFSDVDLPRGEFASFQYAFLTGFAEFSKEAEASDQPFEGPVPRLWRIW